MSDKFEYNYSAPTEDERGEIMSIRKSYVPTHETPDDLEKLRKLDKKVKNPPFVIALTLGVIGLFAFGLGITFAIEWGNIFVGVILGVVGLAAMILACPVYRVVFARRKKKYAQEILALSDKLLGNK